MRRSLLILFLLTLPVAAFAQLGKKTLAPQKETVAAPPDTVFFTMPDSLSNEYLDTVQVKKKFLINDYSMIGVHYGVQLLNTSFNPVWNTQFIFKPNTFGITYTRYGKMFGFMPYFGFQVGLFHSSQVHYNDAK